MIGGPLHLDDDRRCFAYCGDDLCTCDARPDPFDFLRREVPQEELDKPRFSPSKIGRQE